MMCHLQDAPRQIKWPAIGVFGHDISGAPAVTAQQDPRYVLLKAKPPVRRARKADTISETGVDEDRVESAAGVGGAGRSGGDSAGKGSAGGSRADTISETGADEDRVGSAAGVGGAGRSGGDSAGKGSAGGSRAGGTVDGGGTVRPPRQTTSKYKRS
jgi:hypothetical protein